MHDTSNADSPPIIFAGKSLSILDGILLAVKDDVDCLPHPSTGTFSLLQILDVRPKIQFQVAGVFDMFDSFFWFVCASWNKMDGQSARSEG
jgi:hypothetical protein